MSNFNSYYLYQKYIKIGDEEFVPVYPSEFSISGDSEDIKPLVVKEVDSTACGYRPSITRWTNIPITEDYICDDCPSYKLYATYSDSTDYGVECNSSTTLTQAEVSGHSTPVSAMTSAIIGDCVTSIGQNAFHECSGLTSIVIPDSVTYIDTQAFFECSGLTSVTIGSGVTMIGTNAFLLCSSLSSIVIPDNVTSIGYAAFGVCTSLTSVTIGSGVTSIGYTAFGWCTSLTSITIPDSVTSIDDSAFNGCSSLTDVTIGSGVTNIGAAAFQQCTGLTSITCLATTPPTLGSSAFNSTNNCPIYVPVESVETYKTAWSDYASRIQVITI